MNIFVVSDHKINFLIANDTRATKKEYPEITGTKR